ncbi:hypothetical protein [Paenibacillus guangzhouensis]|uniref:hypothetical protein n=1 Tax=Paenibacillus guangzhouensis TaxID=1473112 RepID=UPI0012671D00|nr:hypothetical protein [Paenibacillus guangzhouensis]
MNHSTLIDECRDHRSIQALTIRRLLQLSRLHIDSTAYLTDLSDMHACLIFIDRALDYMLKAVYVLENGCKSAPPTLTHHDVLQLTTDAPISQLDMVTFILNIRYLASCKDPALLHPMHPAHLRIMLDRVEDILLHLSGRIGDH